MHGSLIECGHATVIEQVNEARRDLANVNTISEIKRIRDHAEYLRVDAQHRDVGLDVQNFAAELKLQAERKLGASLADMKLRGGDRKTGRDAIRLKDLGIDKNQSARWQQTASVPEPVFHDYLRKTQAEGKEVSSAAMLRLAKQLRLSEGSARRSNTIHSPSHNSPSHNSPSHNCPSHTAANVVSSLTQLGHRETFDRSSLPALEVHELVDEGKHHVTTLTGLVELLCERAGLEPESGESRACRRYLTEISLHFDYVLTEMRQLSSEHRFLMSVIPA